MSDKIQISEKQAREMLNNVHTTVCHPSINYDETIKRWRQEGYIKQSKLEEARTQVQHILDNPQHNEPFQQGIILAQNLYEPAIAELLEENKHE